MRDFVAPKTSKTAATSYSVCALALPRGVIVKAGELLPRLVALVCGDHGCLYKTHAFALSPPLRDLALMEEWETKDWEERLESKLLRNRLPCPLEVGRTRYTNPILNV